MFLCRCFVETLYRQHWVRGTKFPPILFVSTETLEQVYINVFVSSLLFLAFYTARYGFKVCMRLYLNGDGVGKGTHISLFFVIMKGEYDLLLSWPFKHKVRKALCVISV